MPNLADNSRVTFATKQIAGVTTEDFGLKTDTVDVTNKDSAQWSEIFPTMKNGSLSVNINFETKPGSPTKAYLKDFVDAQMAFTLTAWTFALSATAGDMKFTGNAYVTDVKITAKTKEVVTAAITITPSGTITLTTV